MIWRTSYWKRKGYRWVSVPGCYSETICGLYPFKTQNILFLINYCEGNCPHLSSLVVSPKSLSSNKPGAGGGSAGSCEASCDLPADPLATVSAAAAVGDYGIALWDGWMPYEQRQIKSSSQSSSQTYLEHMSPRDEALGQNGYNTGRARKFHVFFESGRVAGWG